MIRQYHSLLTLLLAVPSLSVLSQEPDIGKSRLYVSIDAKVALSAPRDRGFSAELDLCQTSGGTLIGRTEKGHLVYEVSTDSKRTAVENVTKEEYVKAVADSAPAGAGGISKIKRLIVRYKREERPTDEQFAEAGLIVVPKKESKSGSWIVVEAREGVTAETVRKLKGIEAVTFAEAERLLSIPRPIKKPEAPAEPARASKKPPSNAGTLGPLSEPFFIDRKLWGMEKINASRCWEAGIRKSTVIVAVIDSGVDVEHPEFKGNLWENKKEKEGVTGKDDDENGYDDDINGYDFFASSVQIKDDDGHGTHCAGTIGATADGAGVLGVCPKVQIMALRFFGNTGGANYDAILCIDYAVDKGAKIISASWGEYGEAPSEELEAAIERARLNGVLFIAAAGNEGYDNDGTIKRWPASSTKDNVISVMAVDANDKCQFPTWTSNYGHQTVHLAAPGEDIWSTSPKGDFQSRSGTSMAVPHVAGAAALVMGNPSYSGDYRAVKKALLENARKTAELEKKCSTASVLDLSFLIAK